MSTFLDLVFALIGLAGILGAVLAVLWLIVAVVDYLVDNEEELE